MSTQSGVRLSVVIPAYNEEHRLPGTLNHALKYLASQSYRSEIIVVNDGSTDGSLAVLDRGREFLATLVPGVASAWETVHSLIRPPAAAVLLQTGRHAHEWANGGTKGRSIHILCQSVQNAACYSLICPMALQLAGCRACPRLVHCSLAWYRPRRNSARTDEHSTS